MDWSPVVLAMAEADGPDSVLAEVLSALLQREEVALARIWFLDDAECPVCASDRHDSARDVLHLRASRARAYFPLASSRVDGSAHLVPLAQPSRIAEVATRGEPLTLAALEDPEAFGLERDGLGDQSVGVVAFPLKFRGRLVGVLACYLRASPDPQFETWLAGFAAHAGVAIGQGLRYQDIKRLHDQLELERDYLREEREHTTTAEEIVGRSTVLDRLLKQVDVVAPTEANVLIQGEPGTGKELLARAIHRRSARAGRPLVKVNCASIPREQFESELFGHVHGGASGAEGNRVGRLQLADRGTLFLDEVGEIPFDLQARLLRVLQERALERVGEDTTRRVDVRVLAATSRDLRAEVDAGRFRLDLFYGLSVFPMQVPPLRDRREDIGDLATLFVRQACQRLRRPLPKVPQREIERLLAYDWPGNVRELRHVVERAAILSAHGPLSFDVTAPAATRAVPVATGHTFRTEREWLQLERDNLMAALQAAGGKVSGPNGAAALLGVNPNTLASRLRTLGIRKRF